MVLMRLCREISRVCQFDYPDGPEQCSIPSSFRVASVKFEVEDRVERGAGLNQSIQIAVRINVRSYLVQHVKGEVEQ